MVRGEYESSKERHVFGSFDTDFASWGNSARDAWKAVAEKAYVAGTFVWTGFDYRGEPTPYKWPSVASFFGIYDSCGFEKEACYLYQALWKEEPVVHLLTNLGQGTAEGEDVKVLVASNCEEIVLYIDDKQVASQEMRLYEQNEFILLYTEGVLRVEGYRGGVQVACSEKKPRGEKRRLTLQTSKSLLNADGLDAAIINLVVVDENGTICQDASEQLFFEVDNGIILGTGNGDPNSHEDDVADTRSLFHGCAQVIVKNTGKDDMIFRATGNSVGKAEIRIPVCENTDIPYIQPVRGRNLDGWRMYYKLFAQMPDIHQAEETTDMNSFEPVVFEGNPQSQFKDKAGYYGWYRTEFTIPTVEPGWKLLFGSVIGNVWIYLNEELLIQKSGLSGESLEIALGQNVEGAMRLSVVLQHAGEKDACGIIEPVTLLEE